MASPTSRSNSDELRCHCGSLVARVIDHGIELKCRRCKRVVVIATDRGRGEWVTVSLQREGDVAR